MHVDNSVTQYRPIGERETVAMSVTLTIYVTMRKGNSLTLWRQSNQRTKWYGKGHRPIYLVAKTEQQSDKKHAAPSNSEASWSMKKGAVSLKYQKISAVVMPLFQVILIYPFASIIRARIWVSKAIAHGMWSKAKCLAMMDELPDALYRWGLFAAYLFTRWGRAYRWSGGAAWECSRHLCVWFV